MAKKLTRKPKGAYHHPNLEAALVEAALQTIRDEGVDALTLRGVGARLGVSRTALYRHFEDKTALLARVALEGFRMFRVALTTSVETARWKGLDPMEEMGVAYVGFAMRNPSHYKTMFGGVLEHCGRASGLAAEAGGAFAVLVQTIAAEQQAGRLGVEDPAQLGRIIWANIHGLSTLGMAGQIEASGIDGLARMQWRIFSRGANTDAAEAGERAVSNSSAAPPARGAARRSKVSG